MAKTVDLNGFAPIAVTLAALVAYRIGAFLPLPGINLQAVAADSNFTSILGRLSILALGVLPWFSALTFVELLNVALPQSWTARFRSHEHAQPFSRVVVILALVIAALQGFGIAEAMTAQGKMVLEPGAAFLTSSVVSFVGGTAFLMALGILIERQGIGHGFWMLLAASILASLPNHANLMLIMLRHGMSSPAAIVVAVVSALAIVALIVGILETRRRANLPGVEKFFWPLVLASLVSAIIVDIFVLTMPEGSEDQVNALAKMLTNEPAGFVIGGLIASGLAAIYASREKDWQFFLPAVAVIAAVQLQSIIAEHLHVQPPLAGASLVIVTVVGYAVLMRVRQIVQVTKSNS